MHNILTESSIPTKLVILIKMCLNEAYSKIWAYKHLSDTVPARNGLKSGDTLSQLPDNFTFEYAIRKVQVNQYGLKLNRTHLHLVYTDNINLQDLYWNVINRSKEPLSAASMKTGQEINGGKTTHKVWLLNNRLVSKKYSFYVIIVFTSYILQNNFHQKLHTTPQEPSRPPNIM